MKITVKDNGYKISSELDTMIKRFEYCASVLFPDGEIEHFYYGEKLDMLRMKFKGCAYADFNITKNRVSLTGYTCTMSDVKTLAGLTHNDECYDGRLLQLVNF